MHKGTSWIIERLKQGGYKKTTPRQKIAQWLGRHVGVFSVAEILKDIRLDRVSVYRVVDLFLSLDIIHPALMSHGEQHYEVHQEKHHHHVVCSRCERTKCIICPEWKFRIPGFSNVHHSFIITGLCQACT